LWLPLAGIFLLLTVHSLFVSHRIAGPLYRFRKVYEALAGGDLAIRANIRKHDYLHADARALNAMIQALETAIRGVEDRTLTVQKGMIRLKAAVAANMQAEIRTAADDVAVAVEGLKAQTACFAKKSS
jgi:methyl-accepting chemotaxis protein